MRAKQEVIAMIESPGLIAVVRARSSAQVQPLAEALITSGIRAIEITMTTPDAIAAIKLAAAEWQKEATIGVGTVLNPETAKRAIDAGAEFVVSPIVRPEIARAAAENSRPVMLGAYTPTEAQLAHESGSDYVKLFPADTLGPGYIKAIRAPLPHLKIVPTGGVTVENIGEFFKAGCPAVGIGSSLISGDILEQENWAELKRRAGLFLKAAKERR